MGQAPRFLSIRKRPHHPRPQPSHSTRQGITPGRTFVQFGAIAKFTQNSPYKHLTRVYKYDIFTVYRVTGGPQARPNKWQNPPSRQTQLRDWREEDPQGHQPLNPLPPTPY